MNEQIPQSKLQRTEAAAQQAAQRVMPLLRSIITELQNSGYGLPALNTDLDTIIANLTIGVPATNLSLLGEAVYYDSVNGVAGTAWPVGSPEMPSNNLPDLRTILAARGLKTIGVLSNITIDATMNNYVFIGSRQYWVVNLNSRDVSGCDFHNLSIIGNVIGGVDTIFNCFDCHMNGGNFVWLTLYRCHVGGTLTMIAGATGVPFLEEFDCDHSVAFTPHLNFNTQDGGYVTHNANGIIIIQNMTHATSYADIHMSSGRIEVSFTCTGGELRFYGNCDVLNYGTTAIAITDYRENASIMPSCPKEHLTSIATHNLFQILNGPVRILALMGYITTAIQAVGNNTKITFTPTGGAPVDLCGNFDVTGSLIRHFLYITGVKIDPLQYSVDEGVIVTGMTAPLILPSGMITMTCAGVTTGVIDWYCLYEPIAPGARCDFY